MTVLLASRRQTLFDEPIGGPTLDDLVAGVWEVLTVGRAAPCPVCGGRMEPALAGRAMEPAHAGGAMEPAHEWRAAEVVGRCGHCGSTLT
jgi:hypothetical protein